MSDQTSQNNTTTNEIRTPCRAFTRPKDFGTENEMQKLSCRSDDTHRYCYLQLKIIINIACLWIAHCTSVVFVSVYFRCMLSIVRLCCSNETDEFVTLPPETIHQECEFCWLSPCGFLGCIPGSVSFGRCCFDLASYRQRVGDNISWLTRDTAKVCRVNVWNICQKKPRYNQAPSYSLRSCKCLEDVRVNSVFWWQLCSEKETRNGRACTIMKLSILTLTSLRFGLISGRFWPFIL